MKEIEKVYHEEAGLFPNIKNLLGDVLFGTETKSRNIVIMTGRKGIRQFKLAIRYDYMKNHKVNKNLFKDKRFKNTFEKIYNGKKNRNNNKISR